MRKPIFFIVIGLAALSLVLNTVGYFGATARYGQELQQLVQIKHVLWIAITVYIAGQVK